MLRAMLDILRTRAAGLEPKLGKRRDMHRTRIAFAIIFGLAIPLTGCNRQDKECITRICLKAGARAEGGLAEFRKNFGEGWCAGAGLDSRVSSRLRWDKELENTTIAVSLCGEMVELSGAVKTAEQKKRAYDLALSTLGVKEVADLMQVAP